MGSCDPIAYYVALPLNKIHKLEGSVEFDKTTLLVWISYYLFAQNMELIETLQKQILVSSPLSLEFETCLPFKWSIAKKSCRILALFISILKVETRN